MIEKRYDNDRINTVVASLKNALLSVFDREKLVSVLKTHLSKLGVNVMAIVLYTEDEAYSNYIGGFNEATRLAMFVPKKFAFRVNSLFPNAIPPTSKGGHSLFSRCSLRTVPTGT